MEKYDVRLQTIALMTRQGNTQTKIAEHMGLSKQRIGQLMDKAEKLGLEVVRRHRKKSTCVNCGSVYLGGNKFCSEECLKSRPKKFGGPSSSIQVEIMMCDGCGSEFSRTRRLTYIRNKTSERTGRPFKRVFCTKECYQKNGARKS